MAANLPEMFSTLVRVWSGQFGEAWEAMTGSRPEISVEEAPAPIAADLMAALEPPLVWYRFEFGRDPDSRLYAGSAVWERLGTVVLAAAGVETPMPEDIHGTCLEILNQAAAGLARTLSKQSGREILIGAGDLGPAPPETSARVQVRLRIEDSDQDLFLADSPSLTVLLGSLSATGDPPAPASKPAPSETGKMDFLLDVELPVSVSFGRAQLPLKDVLKLTTGSIVELNRSVTEPVEVIVNNCVIARGDVVVVEGNFGVRIRHVVSRQERLQSLK